MSTESVSAYVDYLHKFGVGSREAEDFKVTFWQDPEFRRVATELERIFDHRPAVLDITDSDE